MANYIEIPIQCPLSFYDTERSLPEQYNFKHFDEWTDYEQRTAFIQGTCYKHKWQKNDIIFLQINANYDPIRLRMINVVTGVEAYQLIMDVVTTSDSSLTNIWLQAQMALNNLDEGFYRVVMECGSPVQKKLHSNVIWVKQEHAGTLLFKFSNAFNNTVMYETLIYFLFRVDGVIAEFQPESQRTTYIDQPRNVTTVTGSPSRRFKLFVGTEMGVPDWVIDILEEILDQTNVEIDGKEFAVMPGAKFTGEKIERYAFRQWNIEVGEVNNRRVKRFESTGLNSKKVVIDYAISLRAFGPVEGEANDNTVNIEEVT